MNGHKFIGATATIDAETFPGQNMTHSLISREYFRCRTDRPFVRHDTRVWESSSGREPRLRSADGRLLLGDEVMTDWRSRTKGSSVRLRAYYDSHLMELPDCLDQFIEAKHRAAYDRLPKFRANPRDAAKRESRITNFARMQIDHQVFDLAEIFIFSIANGQTNNFAGAKNIGNFHLRDRAWALVGHSDRWLASGHEAA